MHTLAWTGYKADPQQHTAEKALPAYYGATKQYAVGTKSTDPQLSSPGHDASAQLGLRIRSTHSANGEILGWLPRGTKVEIASTHGKWGKISSVVEGAVQSYHAGQSPSAGASVGWVYLPEMDSESKPSALDQIYVLPKPHKIAVGELVAYLGEYQRLAEARAHGQLLPVAGERPLLHLEVFTGEDIKPIVTGRVYNSAKTPDWHSNGILSGYKSKEYQGSGYNQMVMDDATHSRLRELPYETAGRRAPDIVHPVACDTAQTSIGFPTRRQRIVAAVYTLLNLGSPLTPSQDIQSV